MESKAAEIATRLPDGFVYLSNVVPTIQLDMRYATDNNFVGCPIDGYQLPVCILSTPAAKAIAAVQEEIVPFGLSLKIFDSYRPQRAVDHFIRWSKDRIDQKMKAEYYPHLPKEALFDRGYLSKTSSKP